MNKILPTLSLLLHLASCQDPDQACLDLGGACLDYTQAVCHGGVAKGLCSGGDENRCCLPCDVECEQNENEWDGSNGDEDFADADCQALGGLCFDNTNYCEDGIYDTDTSICGNSDSDGLNRECCRAFREETDCPAFITREEWGARDPNGVTAMVDSVPYVFLHHTVTSECSDVESCSAECRAMQDAHMDGNGWSDIGYSFLIGGDGNVYEGRGWNAVGSHTYGYNSVSYGIAFIGTFSESDPLDIAQEAYFNLVNCAEGLDKILSGYSLFGHRQAVSTECPGDVFYQTVKDTYPHFTEGCLEEDVCYNP